MHIDCMSFKLLFINDSVFAVYLICRIVYQYHQQPFDFSTSQFGRYLGGLVSA